MLTGPRPLPCGEDADACIRPMTIGAPNATRPTPTETSATMYFARMESTCPDVQSGKHPPCRLGRAASLSSTFPQSPKLAKLRTPPTPSPPHAPTVHGILVPALVERVRSGGVGASPGDTVCGGDDISHTITRPLSP